MEYAIYAIVFVVIAAVVGIGCASGKIKLDPAAKDAVLKFSVNSAGVMLGKYIADQYPDIAGVAASRAKNFRAGDFTAEELNGALSMLEDYGVDPLITGRILKLGEMVGMDVNFGDGRILGIAEVDDKLLTAALLGFSQGLQ